MAVLAVGGFLLVASCGDDEPATPMGPPITSVPESWRGVWHVHVTGALCNTSIAVFDDTLVSDFCPGDPLDAPFATFDSICTGGAFTATEQRITFSCSQDSVDLFNCFGRSTVNVQIDIDGPAGTLSGTGRLTIDGVPGNDCHYCIDVALSGRRGPEVPTCPPRKARRPRL